MGLRKCELMKVTHMEFENKSLERFLWDTWKIPNFNNICVTAFGI
jgi:hypothetical protein